MRSSQEPLVRPCSGGPFCQRPPPGALRSPQPMSSAERGPSGPRQGLQRGGSPCTHHPKRWHHRGSGCPPGPLSALSPLRRNLLAGNYTQPGTLQFYYGYKALHIIICNSCCGVFTVRATPDLQRCTSPAPGAKQAEGPAVRRAPSPLPAALRAAEASGDAAVGFAPAWDYSPGAKVGVLRRAAARTSTQAAGGDEADPGRSWGSSRTPQATLEGQPCTPQPCDPRPHSPSPAAEGTGLQAAAEDESSSPSSPSPLEREPRLERCGVGLARLMKL